MLISLTLNHLQTAVFLAIFIISLIYSVRRVHKHHLLSVSITNELKGFAILAIIFSHIGLFLFPEKKFLYPLSLSSGVAVDIFLFLSGYGLTMSAYQYHQQPIQSYLKRLPRIFVPLWIILITYLLLDHFLLNRNYSIKYIVQSFLGYFPTADLVNDLNSPLWFISLITFYYLLFPLINSRKPNFYSALSLLITPGALLYLNVLPLSETVTRLYKLHYLAFPIGSILAIFIHKYRTHTTIILHTAKLLLPQLSKFVVKLTLLLVFSITALYFTLNSGVGKPLFQEQLTSIFTASLIIAIFHILNISFDLFKIFGTYSYEIYLIHWPILSRYDIFYNTLPESLATIIYIIIFIALGILIQKVLRYSKSNRKL